MTRNEIFAARLKNARVMKGYSMDDLVSAMGNNISKMAISKYEKNQISPNSTVVISLAKALNQPIDYFFRPFTLQIESIKFRKKSSKFSAKQENMIKEQIADLIERYINIEEICNASVNFSSPIKNEISNFQQVKEAAFQLRENWNIGVDGIVNVIDLLLYKIIEEDSSVTIATQLRIAPDIIPFAIIGTVIFINVLAFEAPRLIAASSMLIEICMSVAVADRIV